MSNNQYNRPVDISSYLYVFKNEIFDINFIWDVNEDYFPSLIESFRNFNSSFCFSIRRPVIFHQVLQHQNCLIYIHLDK